MSYSAVIFDLDGTLLNSLEDIAHAANKTLEALGHPTHPVPDYRVFVGAGVRQLFRKTLPPDVVAEATIDRCAATFQSMYQGHWNVYSHLYAGIQQLLDELVTIGVKIAVLSNKPDAFTQLCVEHYFSAWPFGPVMGQRDGIPRKPDPTGALQILDHLQVSADQCLYVGDSDVDMQTATAANLDAVGVLWGFRSEQELREAGAQFLISHPRELLEIVVSG